MRGREKSQYKWRRVFFFKIHIFLNRKDSFLYHCYPNGDGPDADLIKMLERDVVNKRPNVTFDEIAELNVAKQALKEAILLPMLMPQVFVVLLAIEIMKIRELEDHGKEFYYSDLLVLAKLCLQKL